MESQATPEIQTSTITSNSWPGAFGIYKQAMAATKLNGWTILAVLALSLVVSAATSKQHWVVILIGYLASFWLQFALTLLYLAGAHGKVLSFNDAMQGGIKMYVNAFIATILTTILVVLSFVALIIPFFFVAPRLALTLYYVLDKDMSPIDAIKASWNETKGHSMKVWGVWGVTLLFGILCLVLVGIYLSFMYQTSLALLYLFVSRNHVTEPVAAADDNQAVA